MNKYIAKLIFNIVIDTDNTQFDEQIRIIEAQSIEDAFLKARAFGKKEETSFLNANAQQVSWNFVDVTELYSLREFNDGEQIYSLTHEADHPQTFIDFTRNKSMLIQTNFLTFA